MDLTAALTELLDFRTFASIWYWVGVMAVWTVASNWLIGIPFDVLYRARKLTDPDLDDLEALVRINTRRIVEGNQVFGAFIAGLIAFVLTSLSILSFGYGSEFSLGLFLIAVPMTLVVCLNMYLAHNLFHHPKAGRDLVRRLMSARIWTLVICVVSLFLTSLIGMYVALMSRVIF